MKRIFSACSCALAPFAQLTSCLAIWTSSAPVHHRHGVLHKPTQDWVSPGNSCPKRLTRQAKFVLTASFASFKALSANPLLCESYSALSSVLTFTPANFNAVAADSFRAKIAGSLSDLVRTSVKPLHNTSFLSSATACRLHLLLAQWLRQSNDHGYTC